MKTVRFMILAATALLTMPVTARAPAKLTMANARAVALAKAPGRVVAAEYEKEGRGWRYSFDIRQGKRIHEIGVDANTGRIVEDKYERLNDQD